MAASFKYKSKTPNHSLVTLAAYPGIHCERSRTGNEIVFHYVPTFPRVYFISCHFLSHFLHVSPLLSLSGCLKRSLFTTSILCRLRWHTGRGFLVVKLKRMRDAWEKLETLVSKRQACSVSPFRG